MAQKDETKRYTPFVNAANYALDDISNIKIDSIRTAQTDKEKKIIFIANDPYNIPIKNRYSETVRRPDVIITTLHDAWTFSHPRTECFREKTIQECAGRRMGEFAFQSFAPILSSLDFKRKPSHIPTHNPYHNTLAPHP